VPWLLLPACGAAPAQLNWNVPLSALLKPDLKGDVIIAGQIKEKKRKENNLVSWKCGLLCFLRREDVNPL